MNELVNIQIALTVPLLVYVWRVTPFISYCWLYKDKIDEEVIKPTLAGRVLYLAAYVLSCEKCLSFQGGLWWCVAVTGFNMTAITTACLSYLLTKVIIRWS